LKRQFAVAIIMLILLAPPLRSGAADPPLIQTILNGTAAYCSRLEHAAFRFTCLEQVKQKSHRWGSHAFVYDYQLIKEGDEIEERRKPAAGAHQAFFYETMACFFSLAGLPSSFPLRSHRATPIPMATNSARAFGTFFS